MPWTPSIPPAHNTGTNYHPWDGLRFVLVKLDNRTLHIVKTRWGSYSVQSGINKTSKFNGCVGGTGAGYTHKLAADRGVTCGTSIIPTSGAAWPANGAGAALTSFGPANSASISSACIPWENISTDLPGGTSAPNQPNRGWRTMVDCVSGWDGTTGGSASYASYEHIARPNAGFYSCNVNTGGTLNYGVDATKLNANTPVSFQSSGGGAQIANNGKGAYNDSVYFHEHQFGGSGFSGIAWSAPSMGAGLYASPSASSPHPWTSKSIYATGGWTMDDIVDYSSVFTASNVTGARPDAAGVDVSGKIEKDSCAGSNIIWGAGYNMSLNTWKPSEFDSVSYYAIIVYPTSPSMAANPSADPIIANTNYVLHHDMDSEAMQKIFGENHHLNNYATGHYQADFSNTLVGLAPNYPGDQVNMAYSNTGLLHNLSSDNTWSGVPIVVDSVNNITNEQADTSSYATATDEFSPIIGGILDGEFASLNDSWWEDGNNGGTNPWNVTLLNEYQKALIVHSAFDRYDPNLTPTTIANKQACIFVTKTPAAGCHYNTIISSNFHDGTANPLISEDDNPYFNLHITRGADTVVLNDVATGWQDKGLEAFGASNGLRSTTDMEGMTISGQFIADWAAGAGTTYATPHDMPMLSIQSAGFDSLVVDSHNSTRNTNIDNSTSVSGTARGVFFNFDARVHGTDTEYRASNMSFTDATYPFNDWAEQWGIPGTANSINKGLLASVGGNGSTVSGPHLAYGGATFTDQTYEVLYMGLTGLYEINNAASPSVNYSFAYGSAAPSSGINWQIGNKEMNNGHTMIEGLYCYVTDGNIEWPNNFSNQFNLYGWNGPEPKANGKGYWGAIRSLFTHHSNVNKNNWAFRTGNGLCYNSHIISGCPSPPYQSPVITPGLCANGDSYISLTSGAATSISNQTLTIKDASGAVVYTASYSGALQYTTTPAMLAFPPGNYTYTWESPTCTPNVYFTGSFTIPPAAASIDYSHDPATITNPTTCSSNDGSIVGAFSASNIGGLNLTSALANNHLTWALYLWNTTTLVWDFVTYEQPFLSIANGGNAGSNYTNGSGNTGTGVVGLGCAGINPIASSCSGSSYNISNTLSQGLYRVILFQNLASLQNIIDPASASYADFTDPVINGPLMACMNTTDITLTCNNSGQLALGYIDPVCNQTDDEDQGNNGVYPALTNGYINNSAPWQPTNVGSSSCSITGGLSPYDFTCTNSAGTVLYQALVTATTYHQVVVPGGDTYTWTVVDSNSVTLTGSHALGEPNALYWDVTPTATNATCNSNNGAITGGVGITPATCPLAVEYALSVSNTSVWDTIIADEWVVEGTTSGVAAIWQPTSTFVGLAPGTYYLWFRNACHCAIPSAALVIGAGTNFAATISNSAPGCTGQVSTLTVAITSGTAPYTYTWTTGPTAEPGFTAPATTSATYTQGIVGSYDYQVVVTDAGGCAAITLNLTTASAGALNLNTIVSQIGCSGGTGFIDTTVTGGTAAYTYQWSGSSTATTADLTSLSAGTYTLVVTDAAGCTVTDTYIINPTYGLEEFIDLNQYEYNSVYGLTQTGTAYEDSWYGKYGGPTCLTGDDGSIRLILDATAPVLGAAFPYDVEISNDGGATYWPVRNNAGTVYAGAINGLMLNWDSYDPGTGLLTSTGLPYNHLVDGAVPFIFFELQGGTGGDEWNPGGGYVDLPFTAGSTWHFKLTEHGSNPACEIFVNTTILPSDYQSVDVGTNVLTQINQASCCDCSSYGASVINTCSGGIDITPTLGTYEDHTNVAYSYLWTYASLPTTCAIAGHVNVNTMWANQTTQDLTSQWPGEYTVVVTDSCSGTDTETLTLTDPIVYIDDITWVHPLCSGCCDGTMTITAHGGSGSLEVSVDNRQNWTPITGGSITLTGLCDGVFNIWVRDDSLCATQYFADPDDVVYGGSFDDHCFADADITGIISTSGTWTPAINSSIMTTPTATAFTGTAFTRVQLIATSNFSAANVCVTSHNLFPGGTDGKITLNLTGGNAPYTMTLQSIVGPVYNPNTGMIPCSGIGPLSALPNPCLLTGLPIPTNNLAATSVITITENTTNVLTQWSSVANTGFVSSDTSFTFEQVSVSRDLNSSALGAEYILTVQDSTGCVQQGQIGMDNGMFNLVSIYGAENCNCICPLGFSIDTTPGSPTFEECVSDVIQPACFNGTQGYWTLSSNMMTSALVPSNWGSLGSALYGPWIGGSVAYGTAVTLNLNTLPLKKDIAVITPNLLYNDNSGAPQLGVDLTLWNTVGLTSYINSRIPDIAVFLTQPTWPLVPPPLPTGEWIGNIESFNFPAPVEVIICMASDEKMRMKVDGQTYIYMEGDDTNPPTTVSNSDHFNMFPIILPMGIHTISFEVFNTSGHGFMAYDVISSTMSSGNVFVADCLAPTYTQAYHEANLILNSAGVPISSKSLDSQEVLIGSLNYGYSCCNSTGQLPHSPSFNNGNLFCISNVKAPCEVPLDCGYCVDDAGDPAPQWTEKGPCEDADNGALPTATLLGNEWITDVSALSDLVECPAALANIAYSKFEGGLATDLMDIRCAWLVIMIKYMLKNLNICFTLNDIQDVFAGFLDEVCPSCKVKRALTPAEMAAITNMFTLNTNVTFDF